MKKTDEIKELERLWNFTVEQTKDDHLTDIIKFKDGREYNLRHPSFMEMHELLLDSESSRDHALFVYGIQNLTPMNEKSPAINEEYLGKNKREGLYFWSPLIRHRMMSEL